MLGEGLATQLVLPFDVALAFATRLAPPWVLTCF